MADHSLIEWTDATWNPITGCSVVSPGCTNCYAMKLAGTRLKNQPSRVGLTIDSKSGPVWNGKVRFNEQWLDQPLRWKRPRRIFVCAHGDLFAENVPYEWIDHVFAVMALAPQHTFQVLTKRAARMRDYLTAPGFIRNVYELACDWVIDQRLNIVLLAPGITPPDASFAPKAPRVLLDRWPLPNVWLGVSAEDQIRADERIPDLLAVPAAIRFLSAEPLLGRLDLERNLGGTRWIGGQRGCDGMHHHAGRAGEILHGVFHGSDPRRLHHHHDDRCRRGLDWIIVGGESGPGARPMHPDWARSLRDQCAAAGTAFFFKQWGEWVTEDQSPETIVLPGESRGAWAVRDADGNWGGDQTQVYDVGKKAAGRLLDGVEHNAMPEVA